LLLRPDNATRRNNAFMYLYLNMMRPTPTGGNLFHAGYRLFLFCLAAKWAIDQHLCMKIPDRLMSSN